MAIQVGIIGYGLSGKIFHGAILSTLEMFNIKTIYTKSKVAEAKGDFPNAQVVDDVNVMFEDEAIDLIVVATPNTSHFQLAKKAILHKKHVVIEKPFTITTHDALTLMDLAKEYDVLLSVYHNRRFDGDFKTVKKIVEEEMVGRIVEFESHFDRFRNTFKDSWREKQLPGSGILYDLGSHLIDQALDIFGLPQEVYADISNQRLGEVDDAFEIILYYSNLKVILKSSMLVKEPLPRFIISGTEGSYVKFGLDPQEERLKEGERPGEHWGYESIISYGSLNTHSRIKIETEPGDYRDYYRNIADAITKDKKLIVTAQHGFNVIRIIEAAIHSNDERRRISIKH